MCALLTSGHPWAGSGWYVLRTCCDCVRVLLPLGDGRPLSVQVGAGAALPLETMCTGTIRAHPGGTDCRRRIRFYGG
jgi:hypothetical protein